MNAWSREHQESPKIAFDILNEHLILYFFLIQNHTYKTFNLLNSLLQTCVYDITFFSWLRLLVRPIQPPPTGIGFIYYIKLFFFKALKLNLILFIVWALVYEIVFYIEASICT